MRRVLRPTIIPPHFETDRRLMHGDGGKGRLTDGLRDGQWRLPASGSRLPSYFWYPSCFISSFSPESALAMASAELLFPAQAANSSS